MLIHFVQFLKTDRPFCSVINKLDVAVDFLVTREPLAFTKIKSSA